MGAAGQKLGLRLFLEGIEVPVIAASVQIGINSPATASIQVVPGDKVLGLRARTMVHLFYWDYTLDNEAPSGPNPRVLAEDYDLTMDQAEIMSQMLSDEPSNITSELLGYKLLFSGEVIGVSMTKSPVGRQAVLQCSDFSTYWDTTYQFFASASNLYSTSASVWAGGASQFDDFSGHVAQMNEYLKKSPLTPGLQNVKGLMGGIIRLLEVMGGVPNQMHGVNDFFAIGEMKNHILQQIVCEQNDDTSQRLFDNKSFSDWLNRGMSSMGQMTTFRDMLKKLFDYVYYEVVPNPAAMYVARKDPKFVEKTITSGAVILPESVRATLMGMRAAAFINARLAPTATVDEVAMAKAAISQIDTILGYTDVSKGTKRYLEQAKLKLQQAKPNISRTSAIPFQNDPTAQEGSVATAPRETPRLDRPALPPINFPENRKIWSEVNQLISKALGVSSQISKRRATVRVGAELDRLHTQIFRPDCFFAAPPRCNILFPEQYTQFSYSRNFLQEVTRLRLHEAWEFGINEGILEQNIHFAPSMKVIKEQAKDQGNKSVRALLPWEIYSGILPKFETIHEINYVAAKTERKRGLRNKNLSGASKDYAQRVANFNYLKYRFAARTCEIAAKFSPGLVCGFPAAVIAQPFVLDPVADLARITAAMNKVNTGRESKIALDDMSDNIRDLAIELGAPTQYIGMIAGLGHSVSQEGGNTAVSMTHARSHRVTDDDFLDLFSQELTKERETAIQVTEYDIEDVLEKGDWKKIETLRDITDQGIGDKLKELNERDNQVIDPYPEGGPDSPSAENRPTGAPDLSDLPAGSERFGTFLNQEPPERDFTLVPVSPPKSSNKVRVSVRGEVKLVRSKDGRRTVYVPANDGKLKVGGKGPNGGVIKQIQLYSDGAVMVFPSELTHYVSKKVKYVEEVYINDDGDVEAEFTDGIPNQIGTNADGSPILGEGTPIGTNAPNFSQVRTKTVLKKVSPSGLTYFWRKAVIYEEVKTDKRLVKVLPVEEGLRPPWFSPLYSNWFIGEEIYEPFFGCGSLVDVALFSAGTDQATFGTGRKEQQELLTKLKAAGNDRVAILKALDEADAKHISDVPDIEASLDALAYIYGEVRRLGLDVHRFVNDYTFRPVATMRDMFGSANLSYKVVGTKLDPEQGYAGFHSTSIAPFDKLLGLLDNPDLALPRINSKGKRTKISTTLDPRPGRRSRVQAYVDEIHASRGSLGVGLQG